jgi:DNA-binding transcriptional regulator/RsmH inhibitor MraZ
MVDDIKNMITKLILEHLEKHPGLDFRGATRNKEVDKNTRVMLCAVCGEEFVRTKKKIIGIEELDEILGKYHMNDIAVIEKEIGALKILDIDIRIVENK